MVPMGRTSSRGFLLRRCSCLFNSRGTMPVISVRRTGSCWTIGGSGDAGRPRRCLGGDFVSLRRQGVGVVEQGVGNSYDAGASSVRAL